MTLFTAINEAERYLPFGYEVLILVKQATTEVVLMRNGDEVREFAYGEHDGGPSRGIREAVQLAIQKATQ